MLQFIYTWHKGEVAWRRIGTGDHAGFADLTKYVSQSEGGAEAITIGMFMSDHGYALS